MKPLAECRLYTFVDTAYLAGRSPERVAEELCDGGSDLIQLRAKDWPEEEVLRIAESILPIAERSNVGLVINDHWKVALACGASACHLGQTDFFGNGPSDRSQILPAMPFLRIGISTHSPPQAQRSMEAGADYIAIGPVFPTPTKPEAQAVGLDYVRWAAANVKLPWFAIGGINSRTVDEVLQAGARRICVVSAILNDPDILAACQAFKNRLLCAPV